MYETHTVQTGSYKFAWLVDWWEVGLWFGGGGGVAWVVTLKQRSERKRSLCTHFVFSEAVVSSKEKHSSRPIIYIGAWEQKKFEQKIAQEKYIANCSFWQIKKYIFECVLCWLFWAKYFVNDQSGDWIIQRVHCSTLSKTTFDHSHGRHLMNGSDLRTGLCVTSPWFQPPPPLDWALFSAPSPPPSPHAEWMAQMLLKQDSTPWSPFPSLLAQHDVWNLFLIIVPPPPQVLPLRREKKRTQRGGRWGDPEQPN